MGKLYRIVAMRECIADAIILGGAHFALSRIVASQTASTYSLEKQIGAVGIIHHRGAQRRTEYYSPHSGKSLTALYVWLFETIKSKQKNAVRLCSE
jgi:hypothetical protein